MIGETQHTEYWVDPATDPLVRLESSSQSTRIGSVNEAIEIVERGTRPLDSAGFVPNGLQQVSDLRGFLEDQSDQ